MEKKGVVQVLRTVEVKVEGSDSGADDMLGEIFERM